MGARQQLEALRIDIKNKSATRIQAVFRGYLIRRKMKKATAVRSTNLNLMVQQTGFVKSVSSRPKPISCTPPPFEGQQQQQHAGQSAGRGDRCDFKTIQQTCSLFGLDLERPPPIPPSRPYTVVGGKKITFPQSRVMKQSYPPDEAASCNNTAADVFLNRGETVIVIGNSQRRGYLVVEKHNHTMHVPHYYMELKR